MSLSHSVVRQRVLVGGILYVLGQLIGGGLLMVFMFALPVFALGAEQWLTPMFVGALIAMPAMLVYLTVPRLLDRYDPEPLYSLALALFWGAIAACGYSITVNTLVGSVTSESFAAVVSAPIVEEFTKGIMVAGLFFFLKHEFDGVLDGIIYATFTAIGFAGVENILYYGQAYSEAGGEGLAITVLLRGFLTPWGHPLYTSMIGIGFGLARESSNQAVRWLAPVGGYAAAVLLHMLWNGLAVLSEAMHTSAVFLVLLPVWFAFVAAFLVMVTVLARRRGRIIRQHLVDEVLIGVLSQAEVDLTCSAFGGLKAYLSKGTSGGEFVRAIARLGLSKWHAGRAMKNQSRTVSVDFIIPLRQRIAELRPYGSPLH